MSKQAFDKKLAELDALRASPGSDVTVDRLRKALKDRSNYLASKAAALAGQMGLQVLIPDLTAAFDRLLRNPAKSDPQCWAKNAIVKALKDLGHDDPAVYLSGIKHFQPEPTWGGQKDTAGTLRGACALALVACSLGRFEILTHLVDLLVDPEKPVRIDAARAIGQLSGPDSVLLLRLKALASAESRRAMRSPNRELEEPEIVGQCFACLLDMSPRDQLPFVARFLESADDDMSLEAISALGECRDPEAVEILKQTWRDRADSETKRAVLFSLGTSRQLPAVEFLVTVVEDESLEQAANALSALSANRLREEFRERIAAAVKDRGDAKLKAAFEKAYL